MWPFNLKREEALEVVISAAGPKSAKERLDVVSQMLGDDWIPESRKNDLTIKGVGIGHDESRRVLLKLLAEQPDKRQQILADWEIVFGDGSLGIHIRALQAAGTGPRPPSPADLV